MLKFTKLYGPNKRSGRAAANCHKYGSRTSWPASAGNILDSSISARLARLLSVDCTNALTLQSFVI
jgi:hypothetical protein